jgi:hypothetical protein
VSDAWFETLCVRVREVAGPDAERLLCEECLAQPEPLGGKGAAAVRSQVAWIKGAAEALGRHLSEDMATEALLRCGRGCISAGHLKKAREVKRDASDPAEVAALWNGRVVPQVTWDGEAFLVTYPKCYCHHVNKSVETVMPRHYCQCSRGCVP